jgi:hypothetical protein
MPETPVSANPYMQKSAQRLWREQPHFSRSFAMFFGLLSAGSAALGSRKRRQFPDNSFRAILLITYKL